MNISSLILESLEKNKKNKLKKLALAAGAAVLGGHAVHKLYKQHKRNLRAEKADRIANITGLTGTTISGGIAGKKIEKMADTVSYPVVKHTGVVGGAIGGGVVHGLVRLASKGIARAAYGKDTFSNRHKKALLRGALTTAGSGYATKKIADAGTYIDTTSKIAQRIKNQYLSTKSDG